MLEQFELLLDGLLRGFPLCLEAQGVELAVGCFEWCGGRRRVGALAHRLQLPCQALVLALHVRELVPNHRDLPLEQLQALSVLGGELLRDASGLRVADFGGQPAAPLRIGKMLRFGSTLPFRGSQPVSAHPGRHLQLHQGVVQSGGPRAAVRLAGEQTVESRAQFIEAHRSNVTAGMYVWESSMKTLLALPLGLALFTGCSSDKPGNYRCGFATVAGQSMLLDQFNQAGTVLGSLPAQIPEILPVRIALGPAFRSVTGRADSLLVVGVEGTLPPTPILGFGVLIVSPAHGVEGVLLYEGSAILDAPRLGTVNAGALNLPLIGLRIDLGRFQNQSCPIFPDSLRR